jgi:hypothetical protein
VTNQTHEPVPGRSTSYTAFTVLKKAIAQRYEHAETEKRARELRAARDQEQLCPRREERLR